MLALRNDGNSSGYYSLRYLAVVACTAVVLGLGAWVVQNRQLAVASAVLGLYALHLVSVRYILENQKRHATALEIQWELLQRLLDPEEPAGTSPSPGSVEPQAADTARAVSTSWPPPGLPLSTLDTAGAAAPTVGPVRAPSPDAGPSVSIDVPIPRHFALGTVALIRRMLTPAEVARVLMEQRRQPDKRFATLAVELGLLEEAQREELLLAQQEGLFTEEDMRRARETLREFRETSARAISRYG